MPVATGPVICRLTRVDLADAGLAEDELAGVGDQAGAQPGQRVQADDLAPQLVPADRRARGRGAGAGDERVQAADLGGGGLVLRCRGDVRGAAGAGDLPSPRRRDRCLARRVAGAGACRRPAGRRAGLRGPGRTGRGAAMSWRLPGASAASGGPARPGRSRTAGWRPTRRPGCRSSGAAGSWRTRRRPRSRRRRGAARPSLATVTVTYRETRHDPGAGGFLGGGLPGAGLVVAVPRGLVPPGAALVHAPRNWAALTSASRTRVASAAGNGRYCSDDPLGVAARVRPGGPARRRCTFCRGASCQAQVTLIAAVVPVAVRAASSAPTGPASAQPSSCAWRWRCGRGEERLTSPRAAGSNAVRTIAGDLGGAGPAQHGHPAGAQRVIPGRAATRPTSAAAAVRSGGRGRDCAGSNVMRHAGVDIGGRGRGRPRRAGP